MGVLKIPSLFIPIPWVTHNEQEENAKVLVNLGLAEILPEGELTPENLVLRIRKFQERDREHDKDAIEKIFLKHFLQCCIIIMENIGYNNKFKETNKCLDLIVKGGNKLSGEINSRRKQKFCITCYLCNFT
jgi:hypothetical protein